MNKIQVIRIKIWNGGPLKAVNKYICLGQTFKINKENQTVEVKKQPDLYKQNYQPQNI